MKILKLYSDKFEILSEDGEGKLTSGFSEVFEGEALDLMVTDGHNCNTNRIQCVQNGCGNTCGSQ